MWRDLERICGDLSLPFQQPQPFPQNSLLAARVALAALDEDKAKGEDLCVALFHAEFGQSRRIGDVAVVGEILEDLKFEAKSVSTESILAAAQSEKIKLRLRAQTEEARRLGIFGAPAFTTADGELFWGNDRLERALIWARQKP